jgi:hypothetical protein
MIERKFKCDICRCEPIEGVPRMKLIGFDYKDGEAKATADLEAKHRARIEELVSKPRNPATPPRDGVSVAILTEGGVSLGWWNSVCQTWHNTARRNETCEVQAWWPMPEPPMPHEMPWVVETAAGKEE